MRNPSNTTGSRSTVSAGAGMTSTGSTPAEQAGSVIVGQLFGLLKLAMMYGAGHPQVLQQSRRFGETIASHAGALGGQGVALLFAGEHLFVNRHPLRAEADLVEKVAWLLDEFGRRGVVELHFAQELAEFDLAEVCRRFAAFTADGVPFEEIVDRPSVRVLKAARNAEFDELLEHLSYLSRFSLLQGYANALSAHRVWAQEVAGGSEPNVVALKRVACAMVDVFAADPGGLPGMALLRPQAGEISNRRIDTAIFVIAIGRHLGLDDLALGELALASLSYPVPDDWGPWWTREAMDAGAAARWSTRSRTELEQLICFEGCVPPAVNLPVEYYGGPARRHAASAIVSAASAFVDLLQPGEGSSPFSPEVALQMMISQAGEFFEAVVVSALVQALGIYPPGSLVRLNSGDLTVVLAPPTRGGDLRRPYVRPIKFGATEIYDLSRPELDTYKIVSGGQRSDCEVNPIFVFLQ